MKKRTNILISSLSLFIFVSAVFLPIHSFAGTSPNIISNKDYVAGELIIKFKTNGKDLVDSLSNKYGLELVKLIYNNSLDRLNRLREKFKKRLKRAPKWVGKQNIGSAYIFRVDEGADIKQLCAEISKDSNVQYCHPNYVFETNAIYNPDDPYFNSYGSWGQDNWDQWALRNIKAVDDTTGESVWDITRGGGITVAVIDTGVEYSNFDLADNIWINEGEIPNNGIDDDANGYIDDVRGWNFISGDSSNNINDDVYGHGTWIAGIIAATGNNSKGIIGIAPNAKIMPLRVTYDFFNTAPTSEIVEAINYAIYNGADVINISLGSMGGVKSNPILEDEIRFAYSLGIVIVTSAGNANQDIINFSPANMTETITVSSTDSNDQMAKFVSPIMTGSNYGVFIDVAAPGIDVLTTDTLFSGDMISAINGGDFHVGDYYRAQGTSISAAFVSGLAALLLSNNPDLTNEDIKQIIRSSADDILDEGFDNYSGYGRINVLNAIHQSGVPTVKITSPTNKSLINIWDKYVQITGFAEGHNFKEYQLSFRKIDEPDNWIFLEGPVPISTNGGDITLADWDISGLALGSYVLRLTVTTTTGLDFSDTLQISLADLNQLPVFEPVGSFSVKAGEELSFYIKANDADGDDLNYDVSNLPLGAVFSTVLLDGVYVGEFKWIPNNDQDGIYSINFTVNDGKGSPVTSNAVGIIVEKAGNPPELLYVYNYRNKLMFWLGRDIENKWRVKYSYRIDSGKWINPNRKTWTTIWRLKRKFHLKKGRHTLDIKVIDKDGLESKVKSINFKVEKKNKKYRKVRRWKKRR